MVPAVYTPAFVVTSKPIEQNHLTLAFPGLDYNSPKRFALQLLSSILGGGCLLPTVPTGAGAPGAVLYHLLLWGGPRGHRVFCIYTALNKETEAKALATIRQVVDQLRREGPTSEELERAREQSKANVVMGLESTQSRMSHAGRSLLFSGKSSPRSRSSPPMTASPTRMWWLWPRRFSAGIRFPSPLWARCGPPRRTGRWCWRRKAVEYCLLHGLGQSPADWAAVEAGLPGQKILCPDLAAWWADRPVTYESLLEGLEAQCAGREEAMVLCGCSLGAILALDYAWRHPRQVSALVLIAPRVRMPQGLLRLQNGVFRLLPARAFAGQGMGKDQVLSLTRSMLALDLTPCPGRGLSADPGTVWREGPGQPKRGPGRLPGSFPMGGMSRPPALGMR